MRQPKVGVSTPVPVVPALFYTTVPKKFYVGTVVSFSRFGRFGFINQDDVPDSKNNAKFEIVALSPGVLEAMTIGQRVVFKLRIGNDIHPLAVQIALYRPEG